MPKLTKKAEALLVSAFTNKDGVVDCSAISTCQGTLPLWGQLALAGLVRQYQYRPAMVHPFSYEITPLGREYLKGLIIH